MTGEAARRRPPSRRERGTDLGVGAALAALAVASMMLTRSVDVALLGPGPGVAEQVAWCLAVTLPLGLRRSAPLAVLVVVAGAFVGLQARGVAEVQLSAICLLLALQTAGAWARRRALSRAVRAAVVAVLLGWLAYELSAVVGSERLDDLAGGGPLPAATAAAAYATAANVLFFAAAWVWGDLSWAKAVQQDLLERRTVELARERDENARRAVLEERLRIARELHDVVAHHVSVMGVQAGAARVTLGGDPGATRSALAGIEASARQAVGEMHTLLGVLREDGPADPPRPGLDAVDALLATARGAGLEVDHAVVGGPLVLPDGLAASVHRILQEALTNTVRHAAATRVVSRLRRLDGVLEIEVLDDGGGPDPAAGPGVPGLGLVGMRERVAAHGGELEAGPVAGGGFRVRARLPLPVPTAAGRA